MSDEKLAREAARMAQKLQMDQWATEAIAAMLGRVRKVCITEYQWLIDELRCE